MKWSYFVVLFVILFAVVALVRVDEFLFVMVRAHGGVSFMLVPSGLDGGFCDVEFVKVCDAFVYYQIGFTCSHEVHPRVLDLVYGAMRHFDVDHVELVSGYRRTRTSSRHAYGRAMDFCIPGVSIDALAQYLRTRGFVGVGIYPYLGFVHVDVRGQSYFWVDYSNPGRHGREHEILGGLVHQMDEDVCACGEQSDPDVVVVEYVE